MGKVFKMIILSICLILLIACSETSTNKTSVQEKVKEEVVNKNETIYTVRTVDWLFGSWMDICNDEEGCKRVELYPTGLRSTIKENVLIMETKTEYKKGNRTWTEEAYRYHEEEEAGES